MGAKMCIQKVRKVYMGEKHGMTTGRNGGRRVPCGGVVRRMIPKISKKSKSKCFQFTELNRNRSTTHESGER